MEKWHIQIFQKLVFVVVNNVRGSAYINHSRTLMYVQFIIAIPSHLALYSPVTEMALLRK